MKTKTTERSATLAATYFGVAGSGVLLLATSGFLFGARASAGVALGVVLAISNLWVLERLVRVYLQNEKGRWAVIALLKASVLFGMVALLVRTGTVEVLALMGGFGALPLGVVIGGALPTASAPGEG